VFSPDPTEKWATLVWGTDSWGYGTADLPILLTKGLSNSLSLSSTVGKIPYKKISESVANTSTIGRAFSKGIAESVANTTTVGKNISHYYTNTVANTTTVGKNMMHAIYENVSPTDDISRGVSYGRTINETMSVLTGQTVYKRRDDYYETLGGISNAVSWPSAGIYAAQVATSTTWASAIASSTVWT
jgi:hypothetical protein